MSRCRAALAVLVVSAAVADAQRLQPELRLDVAGPPPVSIEPGIGLNGRLGNYVRAGVAIGYDARGSSERAGRRWRADLIARVALDPFREQRVGFSFGGGVSHRGSDIYLAALLDLEGPELMGLLPAVQFGIGGGVRGAFIVRRAIRGRR